MVSKDQTTSTMFYMCQLKEPHILEKLLKKNKQKEKWGKLTRKKLIGTNQIRF